MTDAIQVENLTKTFNGDVRALAGVSFSVEAGTVFGLLGPNGSGKTTIVRILTTIIRQDAGEARLLGYDVAAYPEYVRTLFGLAGQYAAVDENLTGRENLMMVSRLNHLARPRARERSDELLHQFQLYDAKDRPLKTYSGGMRRRLDVAAALIIKPQVLFLDEPTTGLDPQSRNSLWEVIEQLVSEGTTVLLTTQYLEEADRLAHNIAVIDLGHVIAEGTPKELKANLGATVLEVGAIDHETATRAAKALERLSTHDPHIVGNLIELTVDDGPRLAIDALRILDEASIVPTAFTLREPSLDDVFLALTGRQTEAEIVDAESNTKKKKRKGAKQMTIEASLVPPQTRRISLTNNLSEMVSDTVVIMWRNLLGYVRIPEAAFFSSVQPIMFVLLFRYVFGGAIPISIPGISYVDYLIPGIFVQTVAFGAVGTSIGLAQDLHTGLIERFRALPMSRSAVLAGRTLADLVRNVFVIIIITAVGFAVGFRLHTNVLAFIAALGILLLFAYALSWGFAFIGLSAPNAETAQVMAFPVLFPLTFASSAFVQVSTMPSWLRGFANNQPFSIVIDTARALMNGGPTASLVWKAIAWSVGFFVVLGPIAVRRYRRAT